VKSVILTGALFTGSNYYPENKAQGVDNDDNPDNNIPQSFGHVP
jgi:hypothetical protein